MNDSLTGSPKWGSPTTHATVYIPFYHRGAIDITRCGYERMTLNFLIEHKNLKIRTSWWECYSNNAAVVLVSISVNPSSNSHHNHTHYCYAAVSSVASVVCISTVLWKYFSTPISQPVYACNHYQTVRITVLLIFTHHLMFYIVFNTQRSRFVSCIYQWLIDWLIDQFKQTSRVQIIVLCSHQVWWSWSHAPLRIVCHSCPTPKIAQRKCAKSPITQGQEVKGQGHGRVRPWLHC